jgi:beta-phosphoglucomutase-like phosphatase (HAD superfamily)
MEPWRRCTERASDFTASRRTICRHSNKPCRGRAAGATSRREKSGLTGLLDRFAGRIFSGDDVAHGKPAPDLFLHAARTLRIDPARCAVVEDTAVGIQAARAAGMLALGYAGRTPAGRLAAAGARTFTTMSQLPALLAQAGADVDVGP